MSAMTIGRAAKALGINVETIRFYERRGLIEQPTRLSHGGFRLYSQETLRRIRFIRQAQSLGFSLREAAELLRLRDDSGTDPGDFRTRASEKLDDIEAKIARLTEIRDGLRRLLEDCPGGGPLAGCSILDALEGGDSVNRTEITQKDIDDERTLAGLRDGGGLDLDRPSSPGRRDL